MMKFILFFLFICAIIFGGGIFWYTQSISPLNVNDKSTKIFVVDKGSGIKAIGKKLEKESLIKNNTAFYLTVKKLGIENKIQAGDFRLSPSFSTEEIAKLLTHGALDLWVTIPEGKRAEEVSEILKKTLPAYNDTWAAELKNHEGYLFPDTYLIPRDADITQIISLMTNTFTQKFNTITNNTSLTKTELVILASLIEREARHDEDRPLVSSVMHNRLKQDMPLQIDATVQYLLGYDTSEKTWWRKGVTYDDLKIKSEFNTYLNTGLPPHPIASPGIKAIIAAGNPSTTQYLYYITDKNLVNHYSKTLEEHNANIKKYGL